MAKDNQRILITGAQGFIGSSLSRSLSEDGYDVWGVDLVGDPEKQIIECDLLDSQSTLKAIEAAAPFDCIVHLAALAHGQKPPAGQSCMSINTKITENVLKAVELIGTRMIFFSSVAIYGQDGRTDVVTVNDELKPSTEYGKSKLLCEQNILNSTLKHCDILRLAPVFDETHTKDAQKRAYLPGLSMIKIRILPSPEYSLCHIDTIVNTVRDLLKSPASGRQTLNVCDPKPYTQHELVSRFPGRSIIVPVCLLKPFYWMTMLLPKRFGYPIRCLYGKLFCSNVYETQDITRENER